MMLVIDSGLGGLSVVRALRTEKPDMPLLYIADSAGFPYGKRSKDDLLGRGTRMIQAAQASHTISVVVIACNTLSTLCLAELRIAFPALTFVGTVPAIKVAAERSATKRFTLLGTPNTVNSPYTAELKQKFAADCVVDEYGAPNLAALTEALLLGEEVNEAAIDAEIGPCFHDDAKGKTDAVILGCTHYPLIVTLLDNHAKWPVAWIDPSPAIARQALSFATSQVGDSLAFVTAEDDVFRYEPLFTREDFSSTSLI